MEISLDKLRPLRSTLIVALIVAFIGSQRYAGFVLLFSVLVFIPWVLYSVFVIVWRPVRRQVQSIKVAVWIAVLLTIGGAQYYMAISAQRSADKVVSAIQMHIKNTGDCPKNIAALGISEADLHGKLGMYGYLCENGNADFFYSSTSIPFDTERYDFASKAWVHRND